MTTTLHPRFEKHALKQLAALGYQTGDRVLMRALHPDNWGRNFEFVFPDIPSDRIERFEAEGCSVHILVNGGNCDDDISECKAMYYEHDDLDIELSRALWQTLGLPEPTIQVETGRRSIHSFWTFLEPISVELWRSLQTDLIAAAAGDESLNIPCHPMRMAGTKHAKTGRYAMLTGGCGKAYGYEELRSLIPEAPKRDRPSTNKGVTWNEFCKGFRIPLLESVPLEVCLSRRKREMLASGVGSDRNVSAFEIAAELQAVSAWLLSQGQRFDGDPYQLFVEFCQRCDGDDWGQREWDSVWKSAQSKPRSPKLEPGIIENCIRGWAWQNCPNRSSQVDVSGIAKSFPPAGTVEINPIDDTQTDEEKLREAIANYNLIQDAGNQFQLIPYRNWLRKEFGVSVSDIESLSAELRRTDAGMVALPDKLSEIHEQIFERSQDTSVPGIACGFYDLDAMTQGFQRSDLVVAAARPAMGKTSFVLTIARNVALLHSLPVAVFSLEMSAEQLVYRLLSSESQIESGRLRSGRVASTEWEPLGHAVSRLYPAGIYVHDSPTVTTEEIRLKCRALQTANGCLGMVIIDYLQLMCSGGDNRVHELARITKDLKAIARELNVPVIALSQLSRGVESRTNKRPLMSDIRDSGNVEQDADLIMMLYRDEYYNPDTPDRGIAEVIIAKHRSGPVGTVRLLFEPHYTRFRNLKAWQPS